MSKESPIRNQNKQPKKIIGFAPGTIVVPDDIFQMDEDITHPVEKQQPSSPIISQSQSTHAQSVSSNTNIVVKVHQTKSSISPKNGFVPPVRRQSTAPIISPSVSFQERLFLPRMPSYQDDLDKVKKRSVTNLPEEVETKSKPERAESKKVQQQKGESKKKQPKTPAKVAASPKNEYRIPTNKSKQKQILKEKVNLDSKIVPLFSHLDQFNALTLSTSIQEKIAKRNIHPVVISLGIQYSERVITGGNARCMAVMLAIRKVIADYVTPSGSSLNRNLYQHVSRQVDFLTQIRAMSPSMKSGVRFIKGRISKLDSQLPDEDAKNKACEMIDTFIATRIVHAQNEITNLILNSKKIRNGDVILTYARSSTVIKLLIEAKNTGIDFQVIVTDGRPMLEGKETVKLLSAAGIRCSYILTSALPFVSTIATKLIVGASTILSNGDLMSRVGTSVVCMAAHAAKIPVIVICETYKFSETVRLDSFVFNEIGNPNDLVDLSNRAPSEKLSSFVPQLKSSEIPGPLKEWESVEKLRILNICYDITPAKFITVVACEAGLIPSTLVLSLLRSPSLVIEK